VPPDAKNRLIISLDDELRARLDAEAERQGISLASIIRGTLRAHYRELDTRDRATRALGSAAMELADGLKRATEVPWGGHPGAAAALVEALKVYITDRQQKLAPGEVDEQGRVVGYPFDFEYDPETTGKLLGRAYLQRLEEEQEILDINDAMDEAEAKREKP
jgi:hypothetical protein